LLERLCHIARLWERRRPDGSCLHITKVIRHKLCNERRIRLEVVKAGFDAADDWIVEHAQTDDIVITTDVLLARRCLKKGARAISAAGKPFTENNIGDVVATRDLLSELRSAGELMGGPPPLTKRDQSRFLQQLDEIIQSIRKKLSV
jgi:uncharacterized protein